MEKITLIFLFLFLIELTLLNNNKKTYFSKKYDCISLNLQSNHLSVLSQYAITPQSLIDFLTEHKQRFPHLL